MLGGGRGRKKKKHLEAKCDKCATAVIPEEKAINSFEGLQVCFFSVCLLYGWWCSPIKTAVYICCILALCFVLLCFRHWSKRKAVTYFKFRTG